MTHEVVLADIQLAERRMGAGCSDHGIVAELCWPGVDEAKAALLVDALRHGRPLRSFSGEQSRARSLEAEESRVALDDAPRPLRLRRPSWPSRDEVTDADRLAAKLAVATFAGMGLLVLFVASLMVRLSELPARRSDSAPFVQSGDFEKSAAALTNRTAR